MNKTLMAGFILLSVFCAVAPAQVLGSVDYVIGNVSVTRNGEALKKVDIGTPIENLDLIKTSADSSITISFNKSKAKPDASGLTGTLDIVPGTTAIIRQDQLSGAASNDVRLITGSVGLKVQRLAGLKSSIQVHTPSSVLGVRGTEFVVSSFNGTTLVACKEHEVFCQAYSEITTSHYSDADGSSAVPGTMVEILESGKVNSGDFPAGDFDKNWTDVQKQWRSFNEKIFVADPVTFMNQFVANWGTYSANVISGSDTLRANPVLQQWLKAARSGGPIGDRSRWVTECPVVMKDLIPIRPNMVVGMITWYRLQELIPLVPAGAMNQTLANGQTVKAFIAQFNRTSRVMSDDIALFYAAEKQYMLRNDGLSPFMEF